MNIFANANPATLTINAAVAGEDMTSVSNSGTSYNVDADKNSTTRITARLNTQLPAGVSLFLTLAAPPGATSLGPVALTTIAQDVVRDIPAAYKSGNLTITYVLAATPSAGIVALSNRSVTLTAVIQ